MGQQINALTFHLVQPQSIPSVYLHPSSLIYTGMWNSIIKSQPRERKKCVTLYTHSSATTHTHTVNNTSLFLAKFIRHTICMRLQWEARQVTYRLSRKDIILIDSLKMHHSLLCARYLYWDTSIHQRVILGN